MNNVLLRAAALKQLIDSDQPGHADQALAEALVSCCDDLVAAGEPILALELADAASQLVSGAPRGWILRLGIARARALTTSWRDSEALELVASLRHEFEDVLRASRSEHNQLRIYEAAALWHLNRVSEASESLISVRSELLTEPDSPLLARCAFNLSSIEVVRGEHRRAREFVLEALVSARRCGDRQLEGLALLNLSLLERARGRWSSAEEAAREALEIFHVDGNWIQVCHVNRAIGIIAWKRGRLEEAAEATDISLRKAIELDHGPFKWYGSLLKGMILLHKGNYAEARDLFTSDQDWGVPASHSRASLLTTEFLGDIHLEQGQAEPALKLYDEVWPKALALVPKGDIVAELRRRRAECYLLLGRHEEALSEAHTGLDHCRELGDRYEEAATYRVLALAAAANGKPSDAKKWFEQGFAYYDDIETPFEWGKLWLSYGDWLSGPHAGEFADKRGALEACHAAHDHFERMGAQAKRAEAASRIAKLTPPKVENAEFTTDAAKGAQSPDKSGRPLRRPRATTELDQRAERAYEDFGLVTRYRPLLDLLDDVGKLARSNSPILVLGESGTGKELIASGIHRGSGLAGNFMPINCGALPRDIIESELFGHVAGAFSGALKDKLGLFENCDGGTVFLDEIAEMSQELQSRLLRFLETGELRRVGATKNVRVNTRVVAATNRERTALEKGEGFRTDLYYRLAHAVITLPPLRRRGDDLALLIDHFLAEARREEDKRVRLSLSARRRMIAHSWPGNVRQLRSVIRRAVILSADRREIAADELELGDGKAATTLLEELEQTEKRRVVEALQQARGSRTEAAKVLGVPRTTLLNKIKRYGLAK